MKHRSVIAFVIVAAALFAAPQLSHDLQTFKSALGSRLRGELMHAFLSLPAGETGTAAVAAPAPAETLLASCPKARPAAKQRKSDPAPAARAGLRAAAGDQLAMIVEPVRVSEPWSAALLEGPLAVPAELPHGASGEVAMIIPPDGGVDPQALARAAANVSGARRDAAQGRRVAEQVRTSFVATRFEGKGVEWRKAEGELEKTLPGSYEFQLDRDGSKKKVLKVRRVAGANCPTPESCAPRPSGADAAGAQMPAVAAVAAFVSE